MMSKRIFTTVLFLLAFATWLTGRDVKSIPGYMGKKNCISLLVAPNLNFGVEFNNQLKHPLLGLEYERTTSRRSGYHFSAGISNGVTDRHYINLIGDTYSFIKYREGSQTYDLRFNGSLKYSNTNLSLSRSYYMLGRGAISPQGQYIRIGILWNFFRIQEINGYYHYNDWTGKYHETRNTGGTYRSMNKGSFTFELGSRRFLGSSFYIRKSIGLNIPFDFWKKPENRDYQNFGDYHENLLKPYLSDMQTFRISLSAGFAF